MGMTSNNENIFSLFLTAVNILPNVNNFFRQCQYMSQFNIMALGVSALPCISPLCCTMGLKTSIGWAFSTDSLMASTDILMRPPDSLMLWCGSISASAISVICK